jgi:SH3-like domain-containing protein
MFARRPGRSAIVALLAVGLLDAVTGSAASQPRTASAIDAAGSVGASGLPVPRFVSLKSDRVHTRQGPGLDHRVLWVYRRAGLPLEVVREFEGWRQVRDSEGAEGWVLQSLVSGRRTALVLPWEVKDGRVPRIDLLSDDNTDAAPVAIIEAGVIASIRSCDTRWCYVSVGDFRGYVQQKQLWGVYPGEVIR